MKNDVDYTLFGGLMIIMQEKEICVSIIVPVYNVEKFLEKSLKSIQEQTLNNIEIVYVDDGSTDSSCKIIEEHMEKDSRIRLFYQKHAGPGTARNKGILCSRGEYIAFLDADDYYYEKNALEVMYKEACNNKANLCSSYRMLYSQSGTITVGKNFNYKKPTEAVFVDYREVLNNTGFTNYLYRREFLLDNKIFFPVAVNYEDHPFLANAISTSRTILRTPVILYCAVRGYKTRYYDANAVGEVLDGIYYSLKIAIRCHWDNLYRHIIKQLNEGYYRHIVLNLTVNNIEKLIRLVKHNYEYGKQDSIRIYDDIVKGFEIAKYENYVFPFQLIKKNSHVLIYGAGLVGRALYYQAQKYGKEYVDIVGMVDRNADKLSDDKVTVFRPSQIADLKFDTVIITAKLEQTAKDICKQLHAIGVDDSHIIWQNDEYRKDSFYKREILK